MNAVANAIQIEGLTGTAAEIAAAFSDDVDIVTSKPSWNYKELAIKFGRDAVSQIDETLRAVPGLDWVRLSLATTDGLDFSNSETRDGLIALQNAGAFSKEMAAGLLALGMTTFPLWKRAGLDVAPDETACAFALRQIVLTQWVSQISNETIPALITSGATIDEAKAAISEVVR